MTNVGSGSAYNVDIRLRSILEPDASLSSQRLAVNEFTTWMKSLGSGSVGFTIAKNERRFHTAGGNILSPEDFANLVADRRTAFILSRVSFEDDFGSHTVELCEYMEPQAKMPPDFSGSVSIIEIFAPCQEYNGER